MWTIYLKEMLELVRDRKTLIFTILIPILALPLIFGSFAYLSATIFKNAQRVELKYAVFGTQHSPALAQRFAQSKGFSEVPLESIEAIKNAIDDDRIKFALIIPAGFDSNLAQGRQATVDLHYNSAVAVDTIEKRVRGIINTHNTELRQVALSSLNLSKDQLAFALNPIKLDERSTAGKREQMGALIGGILPYILLSVCLMAAMYPAIDLGAGEKERGTLESLLLAPVPRSAIVFAKFGVLFTVGLTSALLMVLSIGALLFLFGHSISINVTQDLTQILRSIGPLDLAMLGLMLVPTSAIKQLLGNGAADKRLAGDEGINQGNHGLPHVFGHPAIDLGHRRRTAKLVPMVVQSGGCTVPSLNCLPLKLPLPTDFVPQFFSPWMPID